MLGDFSHKEVQMHDLFLHKTSALTKTKNQS